MCCVLDGLAKRRCHRDRDKGSVFLFRLPFDMGNASPIDFVHRAQEPRIANAAGCEGEHVSDRRDCPNRQLSVVTYLEH